MLSGSHLVMLGFGENPQLPQLLVQLLHIGSYPRLDGTEIVILQLLALGGTGPKESTSGKEKVLPLLINTLVNQEIFLLRSHLAGDLLHLGVAKQAHDPHRLAAQLIQGPQQRGLFVQGLTTV